MKIGYVIIQAGGRGTRLEKYTFNKPKALLSVDSLPMIFHTFKVFKGSKFIIIGDYKYNVLRDYLEHFAEVNYVLIKANGNGTCAGIKEALTFIPDNEPFLIIWSDLILPPEFSLNKIRKGFNYLGLSKDFECRWSYKHNQLVEEPSKSKGVAGFFIFKNKSFISSTPKNGEFVRYLKKEGISFKELSLKGTKEFGLKSIYEKYLFSRKVSRPFNKLTFTGSRVIKTPINSKGKVLAKHELNWYKFVCNHKFKNIPSIYSFKPFTMKMIRGYHPFEVLDDENLRKKVLDKILDAIEALHNLESPIPADYFSLEKEYYTKTFERLNKIINLVPFATNKKIKINGKWYKNPFYAKEKLKRLVRRYYPTEFSVIHGDPTFSNILLNKKVDKVYLIDPRGYFGFSSIFGDIDYDYAKLYYSLVGNYDAFNQKKFSLSIMAKEVKLDVSSSEYTSLEGYFFRRIGLAKRNKIKLLHAIIWLSLTTYAWDDYDSICGAFYKGVMELGDIL